MMLIFKNDVYYFKDLNNLKRKPVFETSPAHATTVVDNVVVGDVFSPRDVILTFLYNFTNVPY
jgi:hypothetical protein